MYVHNVSVKSKLQPSPNPGIAQAFDTFAGGGGGGDLIISLTI